MKHIRSCCFDRMRWILAILSLSFIFVDADQHLNENGPFGKRHDFGNLPSPYACNRGSGIVSRLFRRRFQAVQLMNVSKTLYASREPIEVTWTPLSEACKDDFVGVFYSEAKDENACDYFDFEFVQPKQSRTTWSMTNLRRSLDFRYYSRDRKCLGNYTLIAKSPIVQPANANEATHVHIAYGDRVDQIYVSYLTNSSQYVPKCQYGLSPTSLTMVQTGTTTTYKASDMCEAKATIVGPQNFIDPGFMHTMLLADLRPSTTYYYRVGTDEHGWSQVYSFTNRPADKQEPVYIIAYGDMGLAPVEPGAKSTLERLITRVNSTNVTSVLHIGDISYARGVGALWDAFMTQVEPIAARVPYMTSIGNHEYDHETGGDKDPSHAPGQGGFRPGWGDYGKDSGGECAVPMVHRFHSPSNGNSLFWYSFDVGPAHVLLYSVEHDFRPNSPQYNWIEKDLRSVNRSQTPWLITGSHREMYTSEELSSGEVEITTNLQLHIEPLFYQYHVDLNLFGHLHSYERTCPVYKNKCVANGVTHVLIGMAGQNIDTGKYNHVEWSKYHDQQYGYSTLYINQTYLHFTYYHSSDDKIADQFELHK